MAARAGYLIKVTGRVQGVFFRGWTVDQARELGVTGWVRNCPDGSVEAHLAGEEGAVGQLIERMRRGPPAAAVADVRIAEVAPEPNRGFEIRH